MNFLGGSIRVGQISGINIRIHVLFLIYIAWRLVQAKGEFVTMAAFMAVLFGIVLLHELGHCFGARSVGGDANDILMWPLGGLAYAAAPMRPWPQFVTVAAGPLVNLLLCVASGAVIFVYVGSLAPLLLNPFGGILLPPEGQQHWILLLWVFYQINLMLLAFNLLPIYPLDGGQLFHAIIWPHLGLQRATQVACYVGLAGCVMLGLWGLRGGGEMLLFIAIFGGFTCWQRLQMARYGMLIDDERFTVYEPTRRHRPGFFKRLFGRRGESRRSTPVDYPAGRPSPNPNPGGWEAKMSEQQRREAEVDRILKKVSEHGVQSLSYVERQTLEQATRERQEREREFERETTL